MFGQLFESAKAALSSCSAQPPIYSAEKNDVGFGFRVVTFRCSQGAFTVAPLLLVVKPVFSILSCTDAMWGRAAQSLVVPLMVLEPEVASQPTLLRLRMPFHIMCRNTPINRHPTTAIEIRSNTQPSSRMCDGIVLLLRPNPLLYRALWIIREGAG